MEYIWEECILIVQQVIKGTGVVKDIDMNSKKITISHEAIPAVGWPATHTTVS